MKPIRPNMLCIARVKQGNFLCTTIMKSFECQMHYRTSAWLIKLLQPAKGIESLMIGVTVQTPFNVGEAVCCQERCLHPVDDVDINLEIEGDTVVQKDKKAPTPELITTE